MSRIIMNLLWAPVVSLLEWKKIKVLVHKPNHGDQQIWKDLVESGQVTPVIDRQYPLHQAAQAIQDLGNGSVKGKAVVCLKF